MHNLDSQAADYVAGQAYAKYGFVLDIHDAFIVSPTAAVDVRSWYCQFMEEIFKNRHMILENYFKSIGITGTAMAQWEEVTSKVQEQDEFKCRPLALK